MQECEDSEEGNLWKCDKCGCEVSELKKLNYNN